MTDRLRKIDDRSRRGPGTWTALELIRDHPGCRAADLTAHLGWETQAFKASMRTLKKPGLAINLETGYRLSLS
ncbi:MAG: hypothetical protein QGI55_14515 [Pseudomonadales bacterium]|jgi:hypothetical protein|nr:hypothetical protein [Pseudomonadales bacterium]|tara:strand:- start:1722 stop:1940 length:219 start_codon:yes stop_codon:yes gene_type:complete